MRCSIKTLFESVVRERHRQTGPRPPGGAASPQLGHATKDIKRHGSDASVHPLKLVLLIVGIVILTVGLLGALYGILAASTAQTEYDFFCPGGQMPPQFCASLLSSVSSYHALTVGMAIFGVVGLVLTIAALAMKGPLFAAPVSSFAPMYMPPVPPSGAVTSRTCPKCERTNRWVDRFCSACGTPLS
jgi:hypothetical protein